MRTVLHRFLASLSFAVAAIAVALSPLPVAAHSAEPPPALPGVAANPASGAEEVSSFTADIRVNLDGTITVVEHVAYFFPESRHGIYRDIPVRYKMDDGRTLEVPVTVQSVTIDNGQAVPFDIQRNNSYLRLKIGDPDAMISGNHEYDITYVAEGALRYFEDHDELYWNVTGNSWEVPIRYVTANVELPAEAAAPETLRVTCFTGGVGSKAKDCVHNVTDDTVKFAAGEPLTVVIGWPKGIVAKLEAKEIKPPKPWPFLVPLAVLVGMFVHWNRHGRDPKGRGTLVVEYDSPDRLTPVENGVLLDGSAGNNDISAIIVDLAVRGYLLIREVETKVLLFKGKDYEFERLKDFANDPMLKPFEKHMLEALFENGAKTVRVSDIKKKQTFYKEKEKIATGVYEELVRGGYYDQDPRKVKQKYLVAGFLTIVIGGVVMGAVVGSRASSDLMRFYLIASAALSGVIILCFAPFMPRPTSKGVLARERVRGFKEYLQTAERYRVQWQERERIFEKLLPYAMAFGVAGLWAKAFASMQLPPPSWYQGSAVNAGVFNPVLFVSSMNDMNTRAVAAMNSQPQSSSSGSGFGGSSGGGFGGGGGGSW